MSEETTKTPPPVGNAKHAEKYIDQLIELLKWDKAKLTHSDLKKYDPSTMQDHYRISLGDYDAEISHSINPNNQQNIYLLIFTNIDQIKAGLSDKAILSYIYLTETIFHRFKSAAEGYFERKRQEAEEARFKQTMAPVDDIIEQALRDTKKDEFADNLKQSSFDPNHLVH